MKLSLSQLKALPAIDKLIVHSLECGLYQAGVQVGDAEYTVSDGRGGFLRSHNKHQLLEHFSGCQVLKTVLRHSSAYDEMVGQPVREQTNMLEVPLGNGPNA